MGLVCTHTCQLAQVSQLDGYSLKIPEGRGSLPNPAYQGKGVGWYLFFLTLNTSSHGQGLMLSVKTA